ncbi:MAG: transglutaminase domain-containing protein, partial [Eubacteriales bacterium]
NTKGDLIGDNAGYHIAGIVGTAMLHRTRENPTTETLIENCHMNGAIEVKTSHSSLIGGIAAYMYRINELEGFAGDDFILNVSSCSFNGNITVKDCGPAMIGLGGIAGQMLSVNANECNAKGEFYIYNSGGAFFGTIAGESASSLYFENSYIIDCEGDVQAIIDGVTYNCSNLFCYSSYSYIKNEKIATELTNKYYYNTLDVNGKALYEEIYTWLVEIGRYPYTLFAANHISAMIDYGKYNLSVEDCNEIFVMVKFDNPSFFYIENKFYTLDNNGESVHYAELKIWDRYLTQEISTDQENLQSILNSVADKTSSLSEYNKIKYIYDFIKENTVYAQYDEYTSTVVGTLLNGTAVCEGYSLTFKYLCDYMGINCIVVASDEMDHAWNIVEVEGKWYYVDTTWSDTGAKDYFLLGSDEFCSDHYTFNDYLKIPEVSTKNYN